LFLAGLEGTRITIRVDFNDVYHVYLSDEAIQNYYFIINETNEITRGLLQNLIDKYNPILLLVQVDSGTLCICLLTFLILEPNSLLVVAIQPDKIVLR